MAEETSSGSFDSAPVGISDARTMRRCAQDDTRFAESSKPHIITVLA